MSHIASHQPLKLAVLLDTHMRHHDTGCVRDSGYWKPVDISIIQELRYSKMRHGVHHYDPRTK